MLRSDRLPRELAPGVSWMGQCLVRPRGDGAIHAVSASYLVVGEHCSAIVDAGITCDVEVILSQIDSFGDGIPEPRYVFLTHSEMGHAGGTGRLLERYPQATVHGDITDLPMVFPEYAERMHFAYPGDRFDLGGSEIVVVESVFRDLASTRWYFDTARRVLFPGDGFAFSHYHEDAACGCFAEEAPHVDVSGGMAHFAAAAFHWTQFVEIEPYVTRLNTVLDELAPLRVAPTHGLPITEPAITMPRVIEGMRMMAEGTAK
jgi:flavorubredoxin